MPLEIKELTIKVSVNQPGGDKGKPAGDPAGKPETDPSRLVRECVEQVIRILNSKKER